MKAMQVNQAGEGPRLIAADLPVPRPGRGEVLIRVRAAGVTPSELLWYPTTHTKDGSPRTGAVPGHEFSGVVEALGEEAKGFEIGQEVYGMSDWFADGATAEFCLTGPASIAPKPASLTHAAAAVVPIGALTAWQGLLERAKLQQGERVLVHGAAGAVGIFAVQLAHLQGAHVIATVSAANRGLVKDLGAAQTVNYATTRFEDAVEKVDVVFDGVGGETLERSWSVLKPGGRMVTIASNSETTTYPRVKEAFFIVEPNQAQLMEVAKLLDGGAIQTFINAVVPLDEADAAYRRAVAGRRGYGKTVISIPE